MTDLEEDLLGYGMMIMTERISIAMISRKGDECQDSLFLLNTRPFFVLLSEVGENRGISAGYLFLNPAFFGMLEDILI